MGPKWVIFVARPIHQWAGSFRVRRPEFPVHHRIVSVPGTKCHSQHALVKASAPNRIVARFAERRYLRLRIATGIARQVGNFPFPTGCAPRLCLTVTAPLTSSSASTSLSMCAHSDASGQLFRQHPVSHSNLIRSPIPGYPVTLFGGGSDAAGQSCGGLGLLFQTEQAAQ